MLLIAHLSKILHSIVLTVTFQNSILCGVFSGHQLIHKGVASFDDFSDFFYLSFLNFFIENLFVLCIIQSMSGFFGCMGDVELFVWRRWNQYVF